MRFRKELIIGTAVIAALIICSASFVSWNDARILEQQSQLVSFTYPYPVNTYDWDGVQRDGDFMTFEDENYRSQQGIDVSSHQGEIDWKQVADAGIEFAFIRAGYRGYGNGELHNDVQFDNNMTGANANGIDAGIYVFSQAITVEEAKEEADLAISSAKKYQIDLPIVFDMEGSIDGDSGRVMDITAEERARMAVTFMNRVKAAGYQSMYYGSALLLENLFSLEYLQEYPLWIAEYDSASVQYPYAFEYWQYSSSGSMPGIEGKATDMDIRFIKKD